MRFQTKVYLANVVLHLSLLGFCIYIVGEQRLLLVFAEVFLLLSFFVFLYFIRKMTEPLYYIDTLKSFIKEKEYSSRFSKVGQQDLDDLIVLFNRMLSQLYEERLQLGEKKGILQKLIEDTPMGIVILDFDGLISDLNPAASAILSSQIEKVKGASIASIQGELAEKMAAISLGVTQTFNDASGARYRVQHAQFVERGFHRRFYLITELTQEVTRSQKDTYDKLIRVMCHEINNTIGATGSLLQSCFHYQEQIKPEDRDDFTDALGIAIERTQSLNQFMQRYASLVKIPTPELASFKLGEVLSNMSLLFQSQLEAGDIKLQLTLIDDDRVLGDQNLLEQVVVNIFKNAMEAIDHDGLIRVEIQPLGEQLQLKVIDSGEGIAEAMEGRLFTPFTTTKQKGQGIGLIFVREVLEAHGYTYSLVNNEQEAGACFSILFNRP
ncbi:PAS domain-containing sensor histidine kinase [Pleionea sp. CnH1-48]|uniref:sensor histidine kinase n=1 Tax=Pleionea sp. CnH1-48 TaxID=2954494 RepID=UPI002096AB17|nr:ATP-binding protein [Pleionea sp. CnH1-48]MCO7226034.1 ATP-binding protein [Pleionea sp. CnH1-48]